jgi:hypothetical protein
MSVQHTRYFVKSLISGRFSFSARNFSVWLRRIRLPEPKVISQAPHSPSIYRDVLQSLLDQDVAFGSVHDYLVNQVHRGFLLRHDLDTIQCLENLPALVAVEASLQLRSTIYVLSDNCFYPLEEYGEYLQSLHQNRFDLALHTRCHFQDDPLDYLETEINRFRTVLGFFPLTVTLHGEYPRPLDYFAKRTSFQQRFEQVERKFNLYFLNKRPYQGFSDAKFINHADGSRTGVLNEEFGQPWNYFYEGLIPAVINTHPIYWGQKDR